MKVRDEDKLISHMADSRCFTCKDGVGISRCVRWLRDCGRRISSKANCQAKGTRNCTSQYSRFRFRLGST